MNLGYFGDYKYTITYHYLGKADSKCSIKICHSVVDAINLILSDENWEPIVFDTWIEEKMK